MWFAGRRSWLAPLFSLLCIIPSINGLHESDVGLVDWHKRLIGVPLLESSFTVPKFHHVNGTSLVLAATVNNVLAALHPDNGTVAWRYIYDTEDRIAGFYKHDNVIATLSGPGGSTLRTFDPLTGTLILEKRLHAPELGHPFEPHHLGKHVSFSHDSEGIYVLSNGHIVTHVDGTTGEVKWTWSSPDQTSLTIYSKLVATPDAVYVVGVSKSFASFTVHVMSLDPSTGAVLSTKAIPSSITEPLSELLVLSSPTPDNRQTQPHPNIVWLEQNVPKSVVLTSTLDGKTKSLKGASFGRIVDIGLCDHGHFVATGTDGISKVLKIGGDGIEDVFEFEDAATNEGLSEPLFGGSLHNDGQVHVSRAVWSHSLQKMKFDTVTSHPVEGAKALTEDVTIPFETLNHGIIEHVAVDAISPTRILITTSSGALQLWQQGRLTWTREEGLANIVAAEFVELPEVEAVSGEGEESFIGRIRRQIRDAQNFPHYLVSFVRRFATGSYASATSPAAVITPSSDAPPTLTRDPFGFRQVIVAATMLGKVYGLDSADGSVLWSRVLGLGWAGETGVGGTMHVAKIFVVGDLEVGGHEVSTARGPQVVLVAQRRAKNTLVDTVVFHINALTGEDVSGIESNKAGGALQGTDIVSGPIVEAYLLHHDDSKVIVLLDEFLQVYLYPSTPSIQSLFTGLAPSLHFPLRTPNQIMGHQLMLRPDSSDQFVGYPTWTLSFPEGETIKAMIKPHRGQVASIGKVLVNRTTLYKYLNPRLFVLVTESDAGAAVSSDPTGAATGKMKQGECGVYVVDAAKGTVIYRVAVPAAGGCDVKVSLAENWLVYHYYDDDFSGQGQTKGWRMVSVELYEGKGIDDKTMSSDMSSYSSKSVDIMAIEQAYVFPYAITAMAPTSTKFGITNKDVIVATKNHQVQSIQRRLLNPSRPSRKVTAEEQEAFLVPYEPVLAYDPRRVLSHNYEVANTQRVITSPALLESTSLVFAYGLDMFLTRVAPSNTFDVLSENFNKVQLVFTISGLALAIMITKPMVRRKKLREKWYQ